ncbi:MAG: DNA polymerase III subunit gamma/tau [Rhodothermaceae bacterium]|nr:DNA polymerase III subunit gamma/tau [Rhodothermaceae bacterium]
MADAPRPPAASDPDPAPRYLVTARKYRPQTFGDVVGQAHVAQTLQNAIRLGRLAHAYLFSGPRGVGKTTAARILAKAVNCTTPLAEREDAEPCRTCDSCRAFEEGRSLNIIEVDAASNNKVEDIRELRETVRIPPQGAKKKIYILDEVHMLSASAFNALLKTLEEPPPYVLFIFATTEPHKVLPTILSRTQRFDFRRIAVPEIVGRLQAICAEEGVESDNEALMLLARKADGALRDALSLFDQAVSLVGTPLHAAPLREALGVVDIDLFFEATEQAKAGNRAGLLALVDRLVQRGYDLPEFLGGLAEHVRHLLVAVTTGSADLIEGTEAMQQRYLAATADWAEVDLLHLLMLVDDAEAHIKESRQPRLATELALLKMASLEPAADLHHLLAKLERLEATLASGALPKAADGGQRTVDSGHKTEAERPPSPAPSVATEPPASYQPAPPPSPAPEPPPTDAPGSPAASSDESDPGSGPEQDDPGESPMFSPEPPPRPTGETVAPAPAPTAPPPSAPSLFGAPALRRKGSSGDGAEGTPAATLTGGDGSAVGTPHLAAPPTTDDFGISLTRVSDAWPRLVAAVKADRVHVGSMLQLASPQRVSKGAVEVAVPDDFSRTLLTSETESVRTALAEVLKDEAPALRFVVRAGEAGETAAEVDPFERLKQLRQEHPVFRALFEKFGAEIVW